MVAYNHTLIFEVVFSPNADAETVGGDDGAMKKNACCAGNRWWNLPCCCLFLSCLLSWSLTWGGRFVYYYSAIYNAAREGARYGVVQPDDVTGMRNRTVNYAFGLWADR